LVLFLFFSLLVDLVGWWWFVLELLPALVVVMVFC
jgi:hypothetical protein